MGNKQSKPNIDHDNQNIIKNNNDTNIITEKNDTGGNNQQKLPNDSIHMNLKNLSDTTNTNNNNNSGSGCPMKKKDGGYWFGGFGGGGSNSKQNDTTKHTTTTTITTDKSDNINSSSSSSSSNSGCPIKHNNNKNNNKKSNSQTQYNVYSQPLDPSNNMPAVANQLPSPQQKEELSTTRVQSNIPKGGGGAGGDDNNTWTYPSPQMFYNSLARKNKLGDTTEEDIESVVALHNNMNEKTWAKVIQWEEILIGKEEGQGSKLLKFMGRPSDLSPKAKLKNFIFGHPLPFDRHDWTVIRNDGTEVRYVIDYYYDETRASETRESAMPALNDHDAVKSILVDVRPAMDTVEAAFGRAVTMPMARHIHNSTKFEPLPILPTDELKSQVSESQQVWANIQKNVEESKNQSNINESKSMILQQNDLPEDQRETVELPYMSDTEAKDIASSFASMISQCRKKQQILDKCKDDAECTKATLALTMCLAKVVCPLQQSAVEKALNDDNVDMTDKKAAAIYNATFDKALENMSICVNQKSEKAAIARQTHPHLFQNLE